MHGEKQLLFYEDITDLKNWFVYIIILGLLWNPYCQRKCTPGPRTSWTRTIQRRRRKTKRRRKGTASTRRYLIKN
jgi:hypothetical protein